MTTALKASCFCCTYGRPHLLEEAIESFLRQDYEGPKELIILNDFDGQTLHFEHPEVIIVNSAERILPLGHKFNVAASMCSGDVLFPWEDDDIYLPWRISYSMRHLTDGIFHTSGAWLDQPGDQLRYSENLYQCNLAVATEKWESVGGYREDDISAIDLDLFRRLDGYSHTQVVDDTDIFYIYRWASTGSYHGSAMGGLTEGVSDAAAQFIEERVKSGDVPLGKIALQPRWSKDWLDMQRRALAGGESRQRFLASSSNGANKPFSLSGLRPWHPGIDFEDHLVVPSRERNQVFILNPVARAVWQALNSGLEIDDIKQKLSARWEGDETAISQDVDGLLQQWSSQGLVGPGNYSHGFQAAQRFRVEFPNDQVAALALSIISPWLNEDLTSWDHSLAIREENDFYAYYRNELKLADQLYPDQVVLKLVEDITATHIAAADEVIALKACAVADRDRLILVMGEALPAAAAAAKLIADEGALVAGSTVFVTGQDDILPGTPVLRLSRQSRDALRDAYPLLATTPLFFTSDGPISYLSKGFQTAEGPAPADKVLLVQLVSDGDPEPVELPSAQRLELLLKECHLSDAELSDTHVRHLIALASKSRGVRLKTASPAKMAESIRALLNLLVG